MKRMLSAALALTVIVSLVCGSHAHGQVRVEQPARLGLINDVEESAVAAHEATEYIESSTAGLIDVDITKLDVEKTARWLMNLAGGPADGNPARQRENRPRPPGMRRPYRRRLPPGAAGRGSKRCSMPALSAIKVSLVSCSPTWDCSRISGSGSPW